MAEQNQSLTQGLGIDSQDLNLRLRWIDLGDADRERIRAAAKRLRGSEKTDPKKDADTEE